MTHIPGLYERSSRFLPLSSSTWGAVMYYLDTNTWIYQRRNRLNGSWAMSPHHSALRRHQRPSPPMILRLQISNVRSCLTHSEAASLKVFEQLHDVRPSASHL